MVTCGGICPGLNTVVRELVFCLERQYGATTIWGVPGGYRGFYAGLEVPRAAGRRPPPKKNSPLTDPLLLLSLSLWKFTLKCFEFSNVLPVAPLASLFFSYSNTTT